MERYQKGIIVGGTGLLYQAAALFLQPERLRKKAEGNDTLQTAFREKRADGSAVAGIREDIGIVCNESVAFYPRGSL